MKQNYKSAFTLIELLVVIAIIGLLATISVVTLSNARGRARDVRRVADIKQVQTALELFFNDQGRYPTETEWNTGMLFSTSSDGITNTYMQIIPVAPTTADGNCTSTNTYVYTAISGGDSYTISFCIGGVISQLSAGNKCATPAGISDIGCSGSSSESAPINCPSSVSYGGETYGTTIVGTQCWLAKNINIGTKINSAASYPTCYELSGQGSGHWSCQLNNNLVEKYCYDNDEGNCDIYGGLYEWSEAMGLTYDCNYGAATANGDGSYAVNCSDSYSQTIAAKHQGICPTGWHIPSNDEWTTLIEYLDVAGQGGAGTAVGGKLKEAGTTHWNQTACDNANPPSLTCGSTNFTALPNGMRTGTSFYELGATGYWWSTLATNNASYASLFLLTAASTGYGTGAGERTLGYAVRCILD